eukprot:Pgem_evm1s18328
MVEYKSVVKSVADPDAPLEVVYLTSALKYGQYYWTIISNEVVYIPKSMYGILTTKYLSETNPVVKGGFYGPIVMRIDTNYQGRTGDDIGTLKIYKLSDTDKG